MESPSSADRRQAWAHSSRYWLTLEDSEPRGPCAAISDPSAHLSLQDEVFTDGCSTGKIETWLQGCGNEANQENLSHLTVESLLKTGNSFEDDLSLGAEATALDVGSRNEELGYCPMLLPPPKSRRKDYHTSTPQKRLNPPFYNMGQSMASSAFSFLTTKTASSVSEVLQMCAEDAEETLYQLGFGCEEPQVTARIPARFFNFPSQLRGINFRLFLESQLRRIREEDPNLSLASRFRQVEVLTAMANAFYSLYSHVSRTPLQKLAPPECSFSSPTVERTIGQRFFPSVRTEPRSPVERLKDTVSKMCLYTGSRGSDSASPNSSPRKRNSLPDVVGIVLGDGAGRRRPRGGQRGVAPGCGWGNTASRASSEEGDEKSVQVSEVSPADSVTDPEKAANAHKERIQRWSQSGKRGGLKAKAYLLKSHDASLETTQARNSRNDTDINEGSIDSPSNNATLNKHIDTRARVAVISYDVLCPHVVECVHQGLYLCQQSDTNGAVGSSPVQMLNESSLQRKLEPKDKPSEDAQKQICPKDKPSVDAQKQICLPPGEEDGYLVKVPSEHSQGDLVSIYPTITQKSPCQIMVTGWEDDITILHREPHKDFTSVYSDSTPRLPSSVSDNPSYLSPIKPQTSHISRCPKQANSFELEEVHSAGEEESISQCSAFTLTVAAATQQKYLPLRGDSFQSDSSGYAEEDMQQSLTTLIKEIN
ncbi:protein ITPRID2 isoform X2 [Electrophorus electricus]|uniref:Thymocyte expressed, positive selection associated 1 n=1 Tax=Electrophorus electricus TaxID=8005 RepID=A0A4W4H032_ELEEL|nr:protein ITPRID2 isoform X2 [Electrophorus electricus]